MGVTIQSKPWDGVERRTQRRAPLRAPVMVEDERGCHTCQCVDVSAGGLLVRMVGPWNGGPTVSLYFELPFGFAVETKARVVWQSQGLLALQFVDLVRDALVALRGFCRLSTTMRAVRPPLPDA